MRSLRQQLDAAQKDLRAAKDRARGIKAGAQDDAFSMQRRAENEKARVDELERKMGSLARAIHDAEELSIGLANAVENTDLANDVMQRTQQLIAVIRQASTRILATDIGKMEAQELEERNREQEMEILHLRQALARRQK